MPSAVKRVRACVICQGGLPAGSRIDRQYCGQACSDRAYYQRHPDKKRVLTARTPKAAESESRTLRQVGDAARKLEADNTNLRRQLEAAHKEIISVKSAASTALSRPSNTDSTPAAALKIANQKIATLTAEVRQANDDAQEAEAELTQAQNEISALTQQLNAAKFRFERAEQTVQHLTPNSRQPTRPAPAPANPPVHTLSKSGAVPRGGSLPPTLTKAPQPSRGSARDGSPLNQLTRPPGPASVREPLPWERPAKQPGKPPIPRWMGMPQENFDEISEFSQQVLEALPEFLYNLGDVRTGEVMHDWLNNPENVEPLGELGQRIVLHIVSIERPQRRNQAQREALVPLVLHHALETMEIDTPALAQERQEVLAMDRQHVGFARLTFELFDACKGKELRHNETRGTWRFFIRDNPD